MRLPSKLENSKSGATLPSLSPTVRPATGVVVATLTSLGDNPPEKIGFSMGTMSGSTCSIVLRNDSAVVTSVITGTVSTLAGSLCISVYDVGSLTETVPFTFTVRHP